MKTYKQFVTEIFGFKKKPKPVENTNTRWPNNKADSKGWMDREVEHYAKHEPHHLHHLFSPASGDYLPKRVHVGSVWKSGDEDHKHYTELKKKHPEAVAKAKEMTTGVAGHVSLSRVGDHSDYHGMSISN